MKNKAAAKKKAARKSDFDSAWKDVIEGLFEQFFCFFFPGIHKDIDFSTKPEFLGKELRKIAPDGNVGNRCADELVKVYLKNGKAAFFCLFVHIEVQGQKDPDFILRVYIYNYRIFDKYREKGIDVISLAVLTDEDKNYRPDEYYTKHWEFERRMKIPLVKIIDYKNIKEKVEELENSTNPMAMVVKAQLKSIEARKGGNDNKFSVKYELIRQCYKGGYDKKYIRILLKFIDWVIALPEDLEKELTYKINKFEEESKMPYVTSWERMGEKRGQEKGERIGQERGERIGEKKGKLDTARRMLMDGLPIETVAKYTSLTEQEIKTLMN